MHNEITPAKVYWKGMKDGRFMIRANLIGSGNFRGAFISEFTNSGRRTIPYNSCPLYNKINEKVSCILHFVSVLVEILLSTRARKKLELALCSS